MSPEPPIVPPVFHCPRCASNQVTGRRESAFAPVTHEYYCGKCGLLEERAEDAPDFSEWQRRWEEHPAPVKVRMTRDEWRALIDKDFKKKK